MIRYNLNVFYNTNKYVGSSVMYFFTNTDYKGNQLKCNVLKITVTDHLNRTAEYTIDNIQDYITRLSKFQKYWDLN